MAGVSDIFIVAIDEEGLPNVRMQFVPMKINVNRKAMFSGIKIIGRNNPFRHFTGGETKMTFEVDYFAENLDSEALENLRFLESLTYAYEDQAPSRVQIIFGDVFDNQLFLIESVNYEMKTFNNDGGYYPRHGKAKLSFLRVTENEIYPRDVRLIKRVDGSITSQGRQNILG